MGHHRLKAAAGASPADPYFSSTSLLLLGNGTNGGQNNTFVDSSANNFTVTRNGNTTQGSFSPFTGAGGSGYFDGSGDYLSAASNAAFDFGTGNFTIEYWSYQTVGTLVNMIVMGTNPFFAINMSPSGFDIYLNLGSFTTISYAIPLNQWNHIAMVRNGSTVTMYVNGNSAGTVTNSSTLGYSNQTLNIAGPYVSINGYIASLRILKGTAQYTANFTPPTSPLTAITNTSLLLNFTNASIIDSAAKNDLETVGDAQVSTSVKKFGTGSLKFDGTGDYLKATNATNFDLTGDFTIEGWFYFLSVNQTNGATVFISTNVLDALQCATEGNNIRLRFNGTLVIDYSYTASNLVNTWSHIAFTRSGSSVKLWLNGTNVASGTTSATIDSAELFVGVQTPARSSPTYHYFDGYIDDLRITKGVARYTAAFTPPSAQLPAR